MRFSETSPDLELVARALAGDAEARRGVVVRLFSAWQQVAPLDQRYDQPLSDADLAEVEQAFLLSIWRKLDRYDGRADLGRWARGFCRLELKKARAARLRCGRVEPATRLVERAVAIEGLSPLERLALREALLGLPRGLLEILGMKTVEGRTFAEIARSLAIPLGSAKTRHYRAVRLLRESLGTC